MILCRFTDHYHSLFILSFDLVEKILITTTLNVSLIPKLDHLHDTITWVVCVIVNHYGDVCCAQPSPHLHESSEQSSLDSMLHAIRPQHPLLSGFTLISQTAGAKGLFLKEGAWREKAAPSV